MKDYSDCWASCLGDCAEGMSDEHLVSKCLFPDPNINVKGFPWCQDEPKPLRVERLVKKILCRKHNRELSRMESAAKHSAETLMAAFKLFTIRSALRQRRWTVKRFRVEMPMLERLLLKTLINLNHLHGWQLGDDFERPHMPTREVVEVAFGLRTFTDAKGLYIPAKAGSQVRAEEGRFQFTAVTYGGRLAAGKFLLWGCPFLLSVFPDPIPMSDGTHLFGRNAKYGFKTRDDRGREVVSHFVTFDYPDR